MLYFKRQVTKREAINRWGKLGYIVYDEYVKTRDIAPLNKGLRIKFKQVNERPKVLLHAKAGEIIAIRHDITSAQAYMRKSVSNYKH